MSIIDEYLKFLRENNTTKVPYITKEGKLVMLDKKELLMIKELCLCGD